MKNYKYILLCASLMSALVSCEFFAEPEEQEEEKVEDRITLAKDSNKELHFAGEGDSKTIVMKATDMWYAESDSDWCHVDPSEGLVTDMKLSISVDPNTSGEERTAHVTVTSGTASLEIVVIQDELSELAVSDADYIVEAEGGNIKVTVNHNVKYEVVIPESASWIKEVKSKALSATDHEFMIEPNQSTADRTAEILFACEEENLQETIKVYQKPAQPEPEPEPEPFLFSIYCNGPEFVMPLFDGDFTGTVFWGDNKSDEFGEKDVYEYGMAKDRIVRFELYGDAGELEMTFFDLVGITGLDLSKLPVD